MSSPLDNPLWSSLTSLHSDLAIAAGGLARYPAQVAPFLGVPEEGAPGDAVRELVAPGETVVLVGPRPAGWEVRDHGVILQMVCEAPPVVPDGPAIIELGEAHRPDVLELTALVYPHYFRPHTMDLGRYFGIYDGTRLAAIAGERMGFPGHRELSAICTHPDFVGRGLARRLLDFLGADLFARGVKPFLHVSPDNTRAVRLYEQNGYRVRREVGLASLRR